MVVVDRAGIWENPHPQKPKGAAPGKSTAVGVGMAVVDRVGAWENRTLQKPKVRHPSKIYTFKNGTPGRHSRSHFGTVDSA